MASASDLRAAVAPHARAMEAASAFRRARVVEELALALPVAELPELTAAFAEDELATRLGPAASEWRDELGAVLQAWIRHAVREGGDPVAEGSLRIKLTKETEATCGVVAALLLARVRAPGHAAQFGCFIATATKSGDGSVLHLTVRCDTCILTAPCLVGNFDLAIAAVLVPANWEGVTCPDEQSNAARHLYPSLSHRRHRFRGYFIRGNRIRTDFRAAIEAFLWRVGIYDMTWTGTTKWSVPQEDSITAIVWPGASLRLCELAPWLDALCTPASLSHNGLVSVVGMLGNPQPARAAVARPSVAPAPPPRATSRKRSAAEALARQRRKRLWKS
jgi:hypothetical protein